MAQMPRNRLPEPEKRFYAELHVLRRSAAGIGNGTMWLRYLVRAEGYNLLSLLMYVSPTNSLTGWNRDRRTSMYRYIDAPGTRKTFWIG